MKIFILVFIILTIIGPLWILLTNQIDFHADWRTANRKSANLAPDPTRFSDAIIQVYSARAFHWRGLFAEHVWISVKPKNAKLYKVYQLVGWQKLRGLSPLMIMDDIPDRYWFDHKPYLVHEVKGEKAEALIPKIDEAAKTYPYPNDYQVWPGPNSNTFPAFIARNVPELRLAMPPAALGKDFLPPLSFFCTRTEWNWVSIFPIWNTRFIVGKRRRY